jgi:hypothetical protein
MLFFGFFYEIKKKTRKPWKFFRACDKGKEIVVVPSIVLLECMYVCEKKRVEFEFQEIMRKIKGLSTIQFTLWMKK